MEQMFALLVLLVVGAIVIGVPALMLYLTIRWIAAIFADSYARRLERDAPPEVQDIPRVGALGRSGHSRPSAR